MTEQFPDLSAALAKASKEEAHFNFLLGAVQHDPAYAVAKRQQFGRALKWANGEIHHIAKLEHELKLAAAEVQQHRNMAAIVYQAATGQITEAQLREATAFDPATQQRLLDLTAIHANHLALLEMLGPTDPTARSTTYNPDTEKLSS